MKKQAKPEIYFFADCINNEELEASSRFRKLYRVVPDEKAVAHGYVRW